MINYFLGTTISNYYLEICLFPNVHIRNSASPDGVAPYMNSLLPVDDYFKLKEHRMALKKH